jgi:hypothetical protein
VIEVRLEMAGRTVVGLAAVLLASGNGLSDASAADPAPVYSGTITDAYLWTYIDYSGRGRDDGLAVVARSHQEEGNLDTEAGWYMVEGLTAAQVLWGASTTASPGTSGACTHSVAIDGTGVYSGSATSAFASWINPWITLDFPDLRKAGGTRVEGPGFTAVSARPGMHEAALAIECGPLGSARWTLPVVVLPAPDPDRPDGVSIEDGRDFTNSPRVRLWLGWEGLVDKVRVSNDGGFAPSKTKEIRLRDGGPLDWTLVELAAERIPRTVYVKLHYVESGWRKQTFTDDIILDTVKPEVVSASMGGSGAATLSASQRTLRVRAKDNKSGIASMQVSSGKPKKKAKVVKFRKAVKVPGAGPVFVRVRDGAGNWSRWRVAG